MVTINKVAPCAQNNAAALNLNARAAAVPGGGGGGGSTTVNMQDVELIPVIDNRNGVKVPYYLKITKVGSTGAETITNVGMDGSTSFTPTGTREHPGQSAAVPTTANEMATTKGYTGELAPGTYNKAAILALFANPKPTKLLRYSFTVRSGTADMTQDGTTNNLPAGAVVERDYMVGFEVDEFSLVVDPSSVVIVQARGV